MRDVSLALQAHLDGGVTTLARCWVVRPLEGAAVGFTEHDRDLVLGAVMCRAATGFAASAMERVTGLGVGDQAVAGVLSDDGLDEAALEAGAYDGAAVEAWLVNWAAPEMRVLLGKAEIGEVRRGPQGFEAELRSVAARLNVPVGRSYQPMCDAVLGDARCGVDLTAPAFRAEGAVVSASVDGRVVTVSGLGAFDDGWFAGGVLTALSSGLTFEIRASGAGSVELWRAPATALAPGEAVRVTAGCDKRFVTCAAKFANAENFRGCPHMPGNDWIASYPVRGEAHDGGRLAP
ncbi:MAG: DUF2163 domain-containing protein [Alphaproteobacteria bacterium]|nr:DUF2163 domain-containing protein [Alphaproteobacteria bacterium]